MDRLVCGDVGFGKTRCRSRRLQAVQDGMQAAVLAPTTLLASQHAQTFADRYAPYPVRVELLSRFLSPAQQKKVVEGLADAVSTWCRDAPAPRTGRVFKRLGLLVVDEEQRFGSATKRRSSG